MKKFIPLIVICLATLYTLKFAAPPKQPGDYQLNEFGKIPALLNGRIQPIDTVARNTLIQIAGQSKIPETKTPALNWFMELITDLESADTRNIFRMHHEEIIDGLNLKDKGYRKKQLFWFSMNDLRPHVEKLFNDARDIGEIKSDKRTHQQQQIFEIANAIHSYQRLRLSFVPMGFDDMEPRLNELYSVIPAALPEIRKSESGVEYDQDIVNNFFFFFQALQVGQDPSFPAVIPPAAAAAPEDGSSIPSPLP